MFGATSQRIWGNAARTGANDEFRKDAATSQRIWGNAANGEFRKDAAKFFATDLEQCC